jgi:hypothetical protein
LNHDGLDDPNLIDEILNSDNLSDSPEEMQLCSKKHSDKLPAQELLHVIQFGHLYAKGKISPVLYSLSSSTEIDNWFKSIPVFIHREKNRSKLRNDSPTINGSDSETSIPSPERKISRKDDYLINTMIKLHESMDKSSRNKEDKDPGFNRLELHRKKLRSYMLQPFLLMIMKPQALPNYTSLS